MSCFLTNSFSFVIALTVLKTENNDKNSNMYVSVCSFGYLNGLLL